MLTNPVKLKVLAVFQKGAVTVHDYLFNYLWKNHGIQLDCRPIELLKPNDVREYDLVLNVICADGWHKERLQKLDSWCKAADKRLINGYEGLKNCSRRKAYKIWSKHGVHCARVEPIVHKSKALALDMSYPMIFRQEYSHLGSTMKLVKNRADIEATDPKAFKKTTIAIEFKDYKSEDGYYRKYRCVLMGNRVVARHLISSPEWNIHSDSRQPERMDRHREEEYAFWDRPLHEEAELLRAKNLLGLDYTIADYALLPDGKPFYFEMNPCYSVIDPRAFKREWAYQLHAIHRYCEVFADFLFEEREITPPNHLSIPVVL